MTSHDEMAEIRKELWLRGDLRHVTRIGPQRETYDFIKSMPGGYSNLTPFVLNFHRRLGKTFL